MIPEKGKVLVDFYASWCGPCKMLMKQLDLFEKEGHDVIVVKIDIEAQSAIAQEHTIKSIPTLVYIEDGVVVDKTVGMKKLDQIKSFVKL